MTPRKPSKEDDIGKVGNKNIVVVAHTYFDEHLEPMIRVISARYATRKEIEQYEKQTL